MSREEIFEEVVEIFREVFDDEDLEINDNTNSDDIEEWDSLENINLMVLMEKTFHIKFQISEIGDLENVGDMVDLIMKKVSENE